VSHAAPRLVSYRQAILARLLGMQLSLAARSDVLGDLGG